MTSIDDQARLGEHQLLADIILAAHQAAGSTVDRSWRALPREHRACLECGKAWPCPKVQWAHEIKTAEAAR